MLPPRNYQRRGREAPERIRSPKHRAFIRQHVCAVWKRQECDGKVDCAHVSEGLRNSMGNKEGDQWTIGLCRRHHTEEHRIGQAAFEAEYGVDLVALAREFAAASPDRAIRESVKPKEKAR